MESLIPIKEIQSLALTEDYTPMLEVIESSREPAFRLISHIGKSHTQFQYTHLDNTAPLGGLTQLRNCRQLLTEINRTEEALEEGINKRKHSQCEVQKLRIKAGEFKGLEESYDLYEEPESIELNRLEHAQIILQAEKLESQMRRGEVFISGAIRKLTVYYEQFIRLEVIIKERLNKDEITELDFEEDEVRHHIIMAFEQSLCAARSRGGVIDNGDFIYFHHLGINGTQAQKDITDFFRQEEQIILSANNGTYPSPVDMHEAECKFLERMSEKYKDCPTARAQRRGLNAEFSKIATLGYEEKENAIV